MGCNDPAHREEFLTWLKERIEKCGFTVDDAPDYMKDAYLLGNPKRVLVIFTFCPSIVMNWFLAVEH